MMDQTIYTSVNISKKNEFKIDQIGDKIAKTI